MKKIHLLAPAKINLFLETLGKRPDGYHNINTVFAKVEIFDKLTVKSLKSKKGISLKVINNCGCPLPSAKDNIVVKAAQQFKKEFAFTKGINIVLEKNIPSGAGLGGGSSDAASVLMGLYALSGKTQNPAKNKKLFKIAAALGADVPFFLCKNTFSAAGGVGEDLFPLNVKKTPLFLVIVYPGFSISTKDVYDKVKIPSRKQITASKSVFNKLKSALERGAPLNQWKKYLFNRLETPAFAINRNLKYLYKEINHLSDGCALMSGSGSSIYAIATDKKKVKGIAKRMQKKARIVFDTCFLGRSSNNGNN